MVDRRTLLLRIVQAFSATGALFLAYPFVKAWLPTFNQQHTLEVDLSDLKIGEIKQVSWLGRNVMIVRRTPEEISDLVEDKHELKDASSVHSRQPALAANQYRSLRPDVFVVYSNCTHLGCEVSASGTAASFNCPCHLSEFDAAGRVYKSAVAPVNLEVPDYQFMSRKILLLVKRA
ncbi:MAG: ubiquinol-cytochrome c reductase iron-sulfur subunit [Pseudomonadales bacterium]|nr:ubiquinol-cytochrome c reductase iron-sulfur subunit [Pseudomonadales bacterium]